MRLFINTLSAGDTPIVNKIPIGVSYVSTRTTTGGDGGLGDGPNSSHIQGIVVDEPNDKVYISWSDGVGCYRWSDLSYQFRTTDDGYHIGDLTMRNNYIYCMKSGDNTLYEYNKSDLSVNRKLSVLTDPNYISYNGSYGYDTNKDELWGGIGIADNGGGITQRINYSDLSLTNETITFYNVNTPSNWGGGIQSFSFMPNSPNYIAFCNYNTDQQASDGTNLMFARIDNQEYQLILNFQVPFDYGVSVVGDKLYLIQKNGGTSNVVTDVLEYDIIYQ